MTKRPINSLLFCSSALLLCAASAAAQDRDDGDRYIAVFRDGDIITGREVKDWNDERSNPHLEGKRFFDRNNPLRLLRDVTIQPSGVTPRIELANGDALPGRVTRVRAGDPGSGRPAAMLINVRPPLRAWGEDAQGEVAVRIDRVARVVLQGDGAGPVEPGTVIFADGRRVRVKAMRWTAAGVYCLTDDDAFTAVWLELAEIHPPDVDRIDALLADLAAPFPSDLPDNRRPPMDHLIGRIVTLDAAVITFRRALTRIEREKRNRWTYHGVQPSWSYDVIGVPIDEVATRGYYEPDLVPLSALPHETVAVRSYTGYTWPWRRDVNVRGQPLSAGERTADSGLGTHAYTAVAFDLPPGAQRVLGWVGIDSAAGAGGCAKALVYGAQPSGKPLWESDFLRGGEDPRRLDVAVGDGGRVVLVSDFGHDGRPDGADPLDIRDEVSWIDTFVRVDRSTIDQRPVALPEAIPPLAGWSIDEGRRRRIALHPFWDDRGGRWMRGLVIDVDKNRVDQVEPLRLTRTLTVDLSNAWMRISAARDDAGRARHRIRAEIGGEHFGSIINGDLETHGKEGQFEDRYWTLAPHIGQTIELAVIIEQNGGDGEPPSGVLFDEMDVGPLVTNMPAQGRPIKPDVALTSLKPAEAKLHDQDAKIEAGKTTAGRDLETRSYTWSDGIGLKADGEETVTYALDPNWTRFVAVIGLAPGDWHPVGPFEVLIDGEVYWQSREPTKFGREDAPRQIDVALPADAKTLTLRVQGRGERSAGAWANAGFMK